MMDMGLPAAALTPVFRRGLLATGMAIIVAASGAQAQVSVTGAPTREEIDPSRRPQFTQPSRLIVDGDIERSPCALADLPAEVSGKVGALKISGGKTPVTLNLKQVAAPTDVEALGMTLVEAGCQSQFQRLAVNTFHD